jgi:hypothetical protein
MSRSKKHVDQTGGEDERKLRMELAAAHRDQLSEDPEVRRLARDRADSINLYKNDLAASRAEGVLKGRAELLLEQFGVRFGAPPKATRARVEAATPEQLDVWAVRVLKARTLDEVFAPVSRRAGGRSPSNGSVKASRATGRRK